MDILVNEELAAFTTRSLVLLFTLSLNFNCVSHPAAHVELGRAVKHLMEPPGVQAKPGPRKAKGGGGNQQPVLRLLALLPTELRTLVTRMACERNCE